MTVPMNPRNIKAGVDKPTDVVSTVKKASERIQKSREARDENENENEHESS